LKKEFRYMTVIAGRLPKHPPVETLLEVPSVQSPDHRDRRRSSLRCLFDQQGCQHVGHLVRPGFCCSRPGHNAGGRGEGAPLLHLLFLSRCHHTPQLVHQILHCLFVGRCHQHVLYLIGPVCHGFRCSKTSHNE
jgi:hypothetical protein